MPHEHGGYESLGNIIARSLGEGLGKGATERIGEEREYEKAERGFGRLAPLRRKKFEEELGYETERGRAKGTMEAEFKRQAQAEEDVAGREAFGQLWGQLMPPTVTPGAGPALQPTAASDRLRAATDLITPATPPVGARAGQLEKALTIQAGREKAQQPKPPTDRGHQPYDDAYRRVLAATGDQTKAELAGREAAASASGLKVGAGIGATQAAPPTATPADRKNILDAEAAILQGTRVRERFKSEYVGILAGGIKGKFGARVGGNTPEENAFRASASKLVSDLRRQFSGLAVTDSEVRNTLESMPDPNRVSPAMFMAILEENLLSLKERVGLTRGQFERPTSQPTTPNLGTPRNTTKYNAKGQRL